MDVRTHNDKNWFTRSGLPAGMLAPAVIAIIFGGTASPRDALAYHFPWDQGHDTTDWREPSETGTPLDPLCDPCANQNGQSTGSPVYVKSGYLVWGHTLAVLPGDPALIISRTYNSNDPRAGLFGNGWSSGIETMLVRTVEAGEDGDPEQVQYILRVGNGKRYVYRQATDGEFISPPGRTDRIVVAADGSGAPVDLVAQSGSLRRFDAAGRLIRREWPDGRSIAYKYNDAGQLTRIESGGGRYFDLTYSSGGFVSAATDSAGRTWRHDYDINGNLVRVTDPEGGVRRLHYSAYSPPGDSQTYHQLTRVVDAAGVNVLEVIYDDSRVASYTEGANRFRYSYQPGANTTIKTDALGRRWTYGYNEHGVIIARTNPAGETEHWSYDADGNLTTYTDAAGEEWTYTYAQQKRRTSATDPLGHTRRWEYSSRWPTPTAILSESGRRTEIAYDEAGQPVRITDPTGADTGLAYDNGHLAGITDALDNQTAITTDAAGRPTRITDPVGRSRRIEYDAAGNVAAVHLPDGAIYRYQHDRNRRLTAITEPSGKITRFEHDPAGRLTAVTDPKAQTTRLEYGVHGRLAKRITPDARERIHHHRQDNRLDRIVRADGTAVSYGYDAAGRLTRIVADGRTTTYAYNARGLLIQATNPTGTVAHGYDAAGRLISATINDETVTWRYNPEGERMGYSAVGVSVDYERSARGQINAIDAPEGRYGITRDALGRRTELTMPHGQTAGYTYNNAGELTAIHNAGPYNASHQYSYDARGRVTTESTAATTWTYGYDLDGQLTSANSSLATYAYRYDKAGNITGEGQAYDEANRLTEDATHTYSYDQRGNLTAREDKATGDRWEYSWSALNRLLERAHFPADAATPDEITTYTYGPLGRRWSRTESGQEARYVYDGLDRIATMGASGDLTERTTFGPRIDQPLATTRGGQTTYLHASRLGSIIAASSATGTAAQYHYSPYGRLLNEPDSVGNDFRYAGRAAEGGDLYYYRARYYDAGIRRFISPDPIGFAGGDTNLYVYASNAPVRYTDPHGLIKWEGTQTTIAAGEGGGAVRFKFELTSECVGGEQATVDVIAGGTQLTLGVPASATHARSIEFEDSLSDIDPTVFHGSAKYAYASWAFTFMGASYQALELGGATANGAGYQMGYDASIAAGAGISTVVDSGITNCSC